MFYKNGDRYDGLWQINIFIILNNLLILNINIKKGQMIKLMGKVE